MSGVSHEPLPAALIGKARAAAAKAAPYLRSRQSYNGGFCFYKSMGIDEPNLHDSYHAIAAFHLLREEVPRVDELVHFLGSFPAAGVHQLYYCAFGLRLMDDAARIPAALLGGILAPKPADSAVSTAWLQATLRAARLKQRFAELRPDEHLVAAIQKLEHGGGYGDKPNLTDTCLCLNLLALLRHYAQPPLIRGFLEGLQRPSFGFTLTSDSGIASLDLIHAGLRCCLMLGIPVRYAADALSFTLACQSASGSFARSPGALPDIEQTHRALQIIAMLASPMP